MALDFWFVTYTLQKSVILREKKIKKKTSSQISPESALPALGAKFNLTEVRESFLMISIRRTLVTNGYLLQKYALRP